MTDVKQVLVYRRDLKMRKGKIAAQCAHASLSVFLKRRLAADAVAVKVGEDVHTLDGPSTLVIPMDAAMTAWTTRRFAKIVLSVDDEAALLEVHRLAEEAGIPCALIRDAGKTEFRGVPTLTTCAVGPAPADAIDRITGPGGAVATKLA